MFSCSTVVWPFRFHCPAKSFFIAAAAINKLFQLFHNYVEKLFALQDQIEYHFKYCHILSVMLMLRKLQDGWILLNK